TLMVGAKSWGEDISVAKRVHCSWSKTTLAWAGSWFGIGQLGLSLFLHHWQPQVIDREFGVPLAVLRNQPSKPSQARALVIGSSRPAMGVAPAEFPALHTSLGRPVAVFNFSQLGSGPLGELLTLRRLLACGISPDWVLIEVWPPLL